MFYEHATLANALGSSISSKPAMSNPNGLLSQTLCHCLDQGRTLNDILMRVAHRMAYFDLSKLLTRAVNKLWHGRPCTLFKIKYLGDFFVVFPQIFWKGACEQAKHLLMYWKRWNRIRNGNRRDKMALRTTCIKVVKFKIIKIRTGWQCVGYFYYNEHLHWVARNLRLGGMRPAGPGLDITDLSCKF